MLLNGTLYQHLADIDESADERINLITMQFADKRGITEELKADNQLSRLHKKASVDSKILRIHRSFCSLFCCAQPGFFRKKFAWNSPSSVEITSSPP